MAQNEKKSRELTQSRYDSHILIGSDRTFSQAITLRAFGSQDDRQLCESIIQYEGMGPKGYVLPTPSSVSN